MAWPDPGQPEALLELLSAPVVGEPPPRQSELWAGGVVAAPADPVPAPPEASETPETPALIDAPQSPAEQLFAKVRELMKQMAEAQTDADVAQTLGVSKSQVKVWIERLLQEGVLEKLSKPTRYRSALVSRSGSPDMRDIDLPHTTATL